MQAIFWHKKTLPALWNCKQKTKLSFCWHKTVQSFFRLLSIFFLSKLTSFLYYFVKKRKREREKTQCKVESFWHKLTGERTDENYQLRTTYYLHGAAPVLWLFWIYRLLHKKDKKNTGTFDRFVFELEKDRGFVRDLSSVWNFEVVQLFSTFYPFLFVSRREAVYYATKIGP